MYLHVSFDVYVYDTPDIAQDKMHLFRLLLLLRLNPHTSFFVPIATQLCIRRGDDVQERGTRAPRWRHERCFLPRDHFSLCQLINLLLELCALTAEDFFLGRRHDGRENEGRTFVAGQTIGALDEVLVDATVDLDSGPAYKLDKWRCD